MLSPPFLAKLSLNHISQNQPSDSDYYSANCRILMSGKIGSRVVQQRVDAGETGRHPV
jgi:hypothetical protein